MNLQKPVAVSEVQGAYIKNLWAQIPFSGSLLLCLAPVPACEFERIYFSKLEIQRIIDFVKETGKLQLVLCQNPTDYEGLDYLEPFFQQLRPPVLRPFPWTMTESKEDIRKATESYLIIGEIKFFDYVEKTSRLPSRLLDIILARLEISRYDKIRNLCQLSQSRCVH